jgi:DNA-directed RNA polymerase subunit L
MQTQTTPGSLHTEIEIKIYGYDHTLKKTNLLQTTMIRMEDALIVCNKLNNQTEAIGITYYVDITS